MTKLVRVNLLLHVILPIGVNPLNLHWTEKAVKLSILSKLCQGEWHTMMHHYTNLLSLATYD